MVKEGYSVKILLFLFYSFLAEDERMRMSLGSRPIA